MFKFQKAEKQKIFLKTVLYEAMLVEQSITYKQTIFLVLINNYSFINYLFFPVSSVSSMHTSLSHITVDTVTKLQFADEATGTQRGYVICVRLHSL